MRRGLISLIVCIALIFTAFFMVRGSERLGVNGFIGLNEKNKEVDRTISNLSSVINSDYSNQFSQLKKTAGDLVEHKTEYENQYILSQSKEQSYANGREKYDIDYLWTILGNYAKDEGVVIQIDVTKAGVSDSLYNLKFTVTGSYIGITNFIYDIENNSKLGFKIDNFAMAMSIDRLYGEFVCKGIPIKLGEIDAEKTKDDTAENTNTTNSTNETKDTNTANKNEVNNTTNETNTTSNGTAVE